MTLTASGGMSPAVAKRQRKELWRDIERDHRRKAKEKLKSLRSALREARASRKAALQGVVTRCRSERVAVREKTRAERARVLAELRDALRAERQAARDACNVRKEEAKAKTTSVIERARVELAAERTYQEDSKRIARGNRERHKAVRRASAKERRSESDDEVRSNIPPDLQALFERVKTSIKSSPRETRTEAFLRYAEENPGEVFVALDDKTDALIRDLERQEREAARYARRRRYTAAELASVPF